MSAPRILYAAPDLRGIEVDATRLLLWPCHMFTVAVPTRRELVLNIFEDTVLRLAAAGCTDAVLLQRYTCLEPGMIAAIQRRLVSLRYLDARHRHLRNADADPAPDDERWESARVYVDLIGGRLLPGMTFGTPEYAECLDAGGRSFKAGGKKHDATRLAFIPEHRSKLPSVRAVHAIARIQNRQRNRGGSNSPQPTIITGGLALSVMENPDLVYLATSAVLQTGNHDHILLSDPFGNGPSAMLAEVFQQARHQADLRKIADNLLADAKVEGRGRSQSKATIPLGPHPVLARKLMDAGKALQAAGRPVRDSEGANSAARATGHCLRALYEAIELALHALVLEHFPSAGLRALLASQPFDVNGTLLWSYAEKLGLRGGERERRLLQLAPGKFRDQETFDVELGPLLALNLGVAAGERDASHPLRALAEAYPDWLAFLLRMKGQRDGVAHGNGAAPMRIDALQARHAEVCAMVELLLPGAVALAGAGASQGPVPNQWRNQERLAARINAGAALAPAALEHLPDRLRKACLELELVLLAGEAPAAGMDAALQEVPHGAAIVDALYMMLQLAVEESLAARMTGAPDRDRWRALALENAQSAGFVLEGERLPQTLDRVATGRLAIALQGKPGTLQACTMALLILGEKTWLHALARELPQLPFLAGELAALRGHGYLAQPVTQAHIERLRQQVYACIPHLTEI